MSLASYVTQGAQLLGRVYSLTLSNNDGFASVWGNELPDQSPLRIQFTIDRTFEGAGTATITLYNLAPTSRGALQAGTQIVLRAGYVGSMSQVFAGKVLEVKTERSGPDIATQCTCSDGLNFTSFAVFDRSYGPNTPLYQVFSDLAAAMQLDISGEKTLSAKGLVVGIPAETLTRGLVVHGPVKKTLLKLCRPRHLVWSVINGQLRIRPKQHSDTLPLTILNRQSGLINIPTYNSKLLTATCLLLPNIFPGSLVQVQSVNADANGNYLVGKTKTDGDTFGDGWTIALEGSAYPGSIETLPSDSTGNFAAAVTPSS